MELWFNDQPAALTTTFITNTSIIARVPAELPEVITNKLKLVFSNGEELIYDFAVDISEPFVSRMKCEYVNVGDNATFYGNYFYAPISVVFTGGVEGEIVSLEDDIMEVKVPVGVQPGPITITNNFGIVETDFWFIDNRNIILSFDNMSGPNGQAPAGTSLWHPAPGDFNRASNSIEGIPSINGNYLYNPYPSGYGAWGWSELWTGNAPAPENAELANIPEEAFVNPGAYSLKMEVNTIGGSTSGAWFNVWIGNDIGSLASRGPVGGQANPQLYNWRPNFDTNGEWQTITIPWSEFYAYGSEGGFEYSASGYDISIVLQGPNDATMKALAIDNVRVVPNTND